MKLRDLPYKTEFYWKGERYRQFMQISNPPVVYNILCYEVRNKSQTHSMPAGREVKPVLKPSDIERLK